MEYYSQYKTGQTDKIIAEHQKIIDALFAENKLDEIENYLLSLSAEISALNVNKDGLATPSFENIEGGPFASVIVKLEEKTKRPIIIGVGANHVVPENDPSAHGEMSAIRDACQRLKHDDLSDTILYTSCECCPMCLSSAIAAGITKIVYANDKYDAEDVGFSDEEQYRYMEDMLSHISQTSSDKIKNLLRDNDAIILDKEKQVIASAKFNNKAIAPMDKLASLQVITKACSLNNHYHLPDGYTLVSRKIPHPLSFVAADWARIGRIRDTSHPEDPSKDKFEKDTNRILYIEDEFEEIANNKGKSANDIADIFNDDVKNNKIGIKILRSDDRKTLHTAKHAFKLWKRIIKNNTKVKY